MLNRSLALLILGAALGAPSWAHADYAYGRVIQVEPVAFGPYDSRGRYQIEYDLGGQRYWTQSDAYPGPWIAVPVSPGYAYSDREEHGNGRGEDHHWWRHHDDD